jgi:hypothetical protein
MTARKAVAKTAARKPPTTELAKRRVIGWKDEVHHRHADGTEHAHEGNPAELDDCGHDGKHWTTDLATGRVAPCAWCQSHGACPTEGQIVPEGNGDRPDHAHTRSGPLTAVQQSAVRAALKVNGEKPAAIRMHLFDNMTGPVVWSEHDPKPKKASR